LEREPWHIPGGDGHGTMATRPFLIDLIQRISLLSGRKLSMIRFEGDRQLPLAPADACSSCATLGFSFSASKAERSPAPSRRRTGAMQSKANLPFVQGIME